MIDDEPGLRHTLQIILRDEGYEVRTADDGEEGLRMALGAQPGDVVSMVLRHGLSLAALGLVAVMYVNNEIGVIQHLGLNQLVGRAREVGAADHLTIDRVLVDAPPARDLRHGPQLRPATIRDGFGEAFDGNDALMRFATTLEKVTVDTVEDGWMTRIDRFGIALLAEQRVLGGGERLAPARGQSEAIEAEARIGGVTQCREAILEQPPHPRRLVHDRRSVPHDDALQWRAADRSSSQLGGQGAAQQFARPDSRRANLDLLRALGDERFACVDPRGDARPSGVVAYPPAHGGHHDAAGHDRGALLARLGGGQAASTPAPSPVACCQSDSVWRSHITRSLPRSSPETPRLSTRSPRRPGATLRQPRSAAPHRARASSLQAALSHT